MTYKELSITDKFIVLDRWLEYNVRSRVKAATGSKQYCYYSNIEKYFRAECRDYDTDTLIYAVKNANSCYYCGDKFRHFGKLTKKTARQLKTGVRTIDHLFSKKRFPEMRFTNKFVFCCARCNNTKGDMHPYEFLRKIMIGLLPALNRKEVIQRIQKILDDVDKGIGPTYYYLN